MNAGFYFLVSIIQCLHLFQLIFQGGEIRQGHEHKKRRYGLCQSPLLWDAKYNGTAQPSTAHTHNLFGMLMDRGWKVEEEKVKKYHKKRCGGRDEKEVGEGNKKLSPGVRE